MTTTERRPGWYADPWRQASWRYWSGARWTRSTSGLAPAVVDAEESRALHALRLQAIAAPSPWPAPPCPPPPAAPWESGAEGSKPDRRIDLPASAFGWGMLWLLFGLIASGAGAILVDVLSDSLTLELAVSQSLLWAGLVGAALFNSRRYGTGRLRTDYQIGLRGVDAPIGLGFSLAARLGTGVIVVVVLALLGSDVDSLPNPVDDYQHSLSALILTVLIVAIGAPLVEELFFRGVLMRSLEPSLRPAGAIVVQAAIFGSMHVNGDGTWQQNVATIIALGAVGGGLGSIAYVTKRLGVSMWTHGLFNVFAAVVMIVDYVRR